MAAQCPDNWFWEYRRCFWVPVSVREPPRGSGETKAAAGGLRGAPGGCSAQWQPSR